MCATCGCGTDHVDVHDHDHDHGHHDDHDHHHHQRVVSIEQDLLAKNDRIAADNRVLLAARQVAAFNLMSAPGSGKTALLEAVVKELGGRAPVAVLEGDQETDRDAARIRATGCPVVQINTGTGCHLDAEMVSGALAELPLAPRSLLFIENVGNLVCPALFDLGEQAKVVVMSVTEGEDKPLKYPHMFRAAQALVLSKIDLLPHLDADAEACLANARRVNPALRLFQVSARTGAGMAALCDWFAAAAAAAAAGDAPAPSEEELRREADRISELIDALAAMGGALVGQRVEELVRRLVHLYGAGLARLVDLLGGAGAADPIKARLAADPLLSSLLVLHGIHPTPELARRFEPAPAPASLVQIDLARSRAARAEQE